MFSTWRREVDGGSRVTRQERDLFRSPVHHPRLIMWVYLFVRMCICENINYTKKMTLISVYPKLIYNRIAWHGFRTRKIVMIWPEMTLKTGGGWYPRIRQHPVSSVWESCAWVGAGEGCDSKFCRGDEFYEIGFTIVSGKRGWGWNCNWVEQLKKKSYWYNTDFHII